MKRIINGATAWSAIVLVALLAPGGCTYPPPAHDVTDPGYAPAFPSHLALTPPALPSSGYAPAYPPFAWSSYSD